MNQLTPLAEQGKINRNASIRDSQSIIINAPMKVVWDVLTQIEDWPIWNQDIRYVKGDRMKVGAELQWNLNGIQIKSTVRRIDEPELLSWTGSGWGIKAIHIWRLEESDQQTIVSTEESVQGFRTIFYNHQSLHSTLLHWLQRLKQRVENQ